MPPPTMITCIPGYPPLASDGSTSRRPSPLMLSADEFRILGERRKHKEPSCRLQPGRFRARRPCLATPAASVATLTVRSVIPGCGRQPASPKSISQDCGYEFRARNDVSETDVRNTTPADTAGARTTRMRAPRDGARHQPYRSLGLLRLSWPRPASSAGAPSGALPSTRSSTSLIAIMSPWPALSRTLRTIS